MRRRRGERVCFVFACLPQQASATLRIKETVVVPSERLPGLYLFPIDRTGF